VQKKTRLLEIEWSEKKYAFEALVSVSVSRRRRS